MKNYAELVHYTKDRFSDPSTYGYNDVPLQSPHPKSLSIHRPVSWRFVRFLSGVVRLFPKRSIYLPPALHYGFYNDPASFRVKFRVILRRHELSNILFYEPVQKVLYNDLYDFSPMALKHKFSVLYIYQESKLKSALRYI